MPQKVSDLFEIDYGHSLSLNKLAKTDSDSGVAFVSRTAKNNGIAAWVEKIPDVDPLPAGLLTVCLRSRNHALATFVQPLPFYCGYHIFVLRPKHEMSLQEKLWWAQCIEQNRYRYNFGRQANRSFASLLVPDDVPSWVLDSNIPEFLRSSRLSTDMNLQASDWRPFRLDEIFDLVRGRNILKRNMVPGETSYVSALSFNNGISARIDVSPDHPAGAITVASNGNGVGSAFYQPEPFIASGDVTVLLPKNALSEAASLFVCTLIYAERYRWNYGRKWVTSRMKESVIRLPVTPSGTPDWKACEEIIESLPLASAVLGR
ncbi:restriction endonuclease subunit S [Streptomyces sp. NPDC059904]|uniref:restriction endonuclease subunit S n=1 Tax=Streptomyces sp. NPDC059904 TaxID=3346996 RepID=UPI0036507B18